MKRIVVFLLVLCTLLTQTDVSMFAMGKEYIEVNGDTEIVPATSITLNHESVEVFEGENIFLIATVTPYECTEEIIWTTSDSSIADIRVEAELSGCEVSGQIPGTVTITATVGDLSASCEVEVLSNEIIIDPDEPVDPDEPIDPDYPDEPEDPEYSGLYFSENGTIAYYINGEIAYDFVGLVSHEGDVYYVLNGFVPLYYIGLVCEEGVWYYVENGMLNRDYIGLVQHYDAWFYVENGQLNWNYTGLTQYNGAWFYVQGGQLNWGYTGLVQHYDAWFYVEGGMLNWDYTGLVQHYDAWFYVQGGQLNWGYTGLAEHFGAWFYVQGGQLNWGYTGMAEYYDAWFYVKNGQLDWSYTGLAQYNDAWFYVQGGQANLDYYGLVQNEYGWWYVDAGKIDFSYNGLMTNQHGTWGVNGGQINFGLNGLIPWMDGWYYFDNGRLIEGNHLVQNEHGWWYVQDGKIDFTTHTVAQNEHGWWYVEDGKINFGYNGMAQNNNGWWMIKNGQVDFSFNGEYKALTVEGEAGTWEFKDGKRVYNVPKEKDALWRQEYAYRTNDLSVFRKEVEVTDFYKLKDVLDYILQYDTLYEQELAYYEYIMEHGEEAQHDIRWYALDIIGIDNFIVKDGEFVAICRAVCLEGEWYMLVEQIAYSWGSYDGFNVSDEKVREIFPGYTVTMEADGKRFNYYRMQDGYVTNIGAYYTYLQEHIPNLKSGEEIMMVLEWEGVENAANMNVYRKTSLVPGAYVNDVQFIDDGEDILLVYTWKKY